MPDQPEGFPSRLKSGGQPMRGVGAGIAANQKAIGAQDPETAARLAGMDPDHVQQQLEEAEKLNEKVARLRADLAENAETGAWKPPTNEDVKNWPQFLARQPPNVIQNWHKKMEDELQQVADDIEDEVIKNTLSWGGIGPESHLYDPLTDKERKKLIEDRLVDMDFAEMLFQGYTDQDVAIRESFIITLRTLPTQHGLWIEYIIGRKNVEEMTNQYYRHYFSLMQVAASLQKINGTSIGIDLSQFTQAKQLDEFETALVQRMEYLGKLPAPITDDLIVQYIWFVGRTRKLLAGDLIGKVGNS